MKLGQVQSTTDVYVIKVSTLQGCLLEGTVDDQEQEKTKTLMKLFPVIPLLYQTPVFESQIDWNVMSNCFATQCNNIALLSSTRNVFDGT